MNNSVLKLEGIKKYFGGVKALKGVDLEVNYGEIHCLAGENGCGKSTLIKVISGAHEPTEGKIFINGKEVKKLKPMDSIHMGIQVIYQDFAIFSNLSVAENIAMNKLLMEGSKTIKWEKARALAIEAMSHIGADIDPDILVERLSVANKQMVAICRAIINDAKLLILDEPTTALTGQEVKKLNTILRELKAKGMAIVIVNHKLDEIYEIADRLTILRNGENVATGLIEEFDKARFVNCLTGRDIENINYRPESSEEKILEVHNLGKNGRFSNVSFTMNKGDVLGITGLLGSGRGDVGEALFGMAPYDTGSVKLNGKAIVVGSVRDAMNNKIGYVPEDRLTQGLFMTRSIQDNTVAASISKYFEKHKLNYKTMTEVTNQWITKIGCNASSPDPLINTLSGGNAQKMVIAKWLNTEPKLLILNGPTVGVDVGSKSDIHKILHKLASEGVGIIIISDDLPELLENCNKILVMNDGKVAGTFESSEISEDGLSHVLSDSRGDAS